MPIFFLSAWADQIPAELAGSGLPPAAGYIGLPFSLDELMGILRTTLEPKT